MKAELSQSGELSIRAENDIEIYALQQWLSGSKSLAVQDGVHEDFVQWEFLDVSRKVFKPEDPGIKGAKAGKKLRDSLERKEKSKEWLYDKVLKASNDELGGLKITIREFCAVVQDELENIKVKVNKKPENIDLGNGRVATSFEVDKAEDVIVEKEDTNEYNNLANQITFHENKIDSLEQELNKERDELLQLMIDFESFKKALLNDD